MPATATDRAITRKMEGNATANSSSANHGVVVARSVSNAGCSVSHASSAAVA